MSSHLIDALYTCAWLPDRRSSFCRTVTAPSEALACVSLDVASKNDLPVGLPVKARSASVTAPPTTGSITVDTSVHVRQKSDDRPSLRLQRSTSLQEFDEE